MGEQTLATARDMADQRVSMPAWAMGIALTAIPLLVNLVVYFIGAHSNSSLLEQRMSEMEHRASATDAKLESIGSHLADLSTNVAVLVERTSGQHSSLGLPY